MKHKTALAMLLLFLLLCVSAAHAQGGFGTVGPADKVPKPGDVRWTWLLPGEELPSTSTNIKVSKQFALHCYARFSYNDRTFVKLPEHFDMLVPVRFPWGHGDVAACKLRPAKANYPYPYSVRSKDELTELEYLQYGAAPVGIESAFFSPEAVTYMHNTYGCAPSGNGTQLVVEQRYDGKNWVTLEVKHIIAQVDFHCLTDKPKIEKDQQKPRRLRR